MKVTFTYLMTFLYFWCSMSSGFANTHEVHYHNDEAPHLKNAHDNTSILTDDVLRFDAEHDMNDLACTTTISNFPYTQGFEAATQLWAESNDDDLNWTRNIGATQSTSTGPAEAYSGFWYMYIEASGDGIGYPYRKAGLVSPCFDLTDRQTASLSFQHHFYGTSTDIRLEVQVSTDAGLTWSNTIWSQTGNLNDHWTLVNINLGAYTNQVITLRFLGTTGETWQGDMAIDDIKLNAATVSCTPNTACNDNNDCTIYDIYDNNCNCIGTFQDTDGDGVCDADDGCPGTDNSIIGTACNDNDDCTINDVYDNNCNCKGTFQDADGDGICDADDACPGTDDSIVSTSCNDNDNCTANDVYDNNCNCAGTFQDADGDGVCNANDICPDGDDNIDTDGDGIPDACDLCESALVGTSCDDNDACTINDVYDNTCTCTGTLQDADGDGVCNAYDTCPGVDDALIGTSCNDNDACTTGDIYDNNCKCAGTFQDADGDGVCDANDICAAGDDNIDTDGDGTPDACDSCNNTSAGTACDDNDACTTGETYDADCNCTGGTLLDANNNEICDIYEDCSGALPEYESFEVGLGNWTQDNNDDLDWIRYAGATPSGDTGPSNATDGTWYMYIEASGANRGYPNKTATLESDCYSLANATTASLEFDYHMYGTAVDMSLQIQISTDKGQTWSSAMWSKTGDQGNQWNTATVNLAPYIGEVVRIRLSGTTGQVWRGDIGIDALSVKSSTTCSTAGQICDDGDACTTDDIYNATCDCIGTFTDADGDGICAANDPNDNDPCTPNLCNTCDEYNSEDFEIGMGIWNDGGGDAYRYSGFASSGSRSIRLRDNSGKASSIYTNALDLSAFSSINVNFSYMASDMETDEDFFLEISDDGGSTYTMVEEWNADTEFVNDTRYNESVPINGVFSERTVIRLRCDASANGDEVYIDDVVIEACGAPVPKLETPQPQLIVYPNPANQFINIEWHELPLQAEDINLTIYALNGKQVYQNRLTLANISHINIEHLSANQIYILHLQTDKGQTFRTKFLKL